MKKKKQKKIDPKLCPATLAGRLLDLDDSMAPVIAFLRVIGRASQAETHSAPDDSVLWLVTDIEEKLEAIRTEIELVSSALRKLSASI